MKKRLLPLLLTVLLLISCAGSQGRIILSPSDMPGFNDAPYIITSHKNTAAEIEMPGWVIAYIDGGLPQIETLSAYHGSFAFVARNESNNFTAMNHWMAGFSPELDFPRLAASRIEERFFSSAPLPDQEYGSYYEAMVRAASDYPWAGAIRGENFWIQKNYLPFGDEDEKEAWEFMILLTIDKTSFVFQLENVFKDVKPNPPPTKDQLNAINRVKDKFFEGF